MVEPASGRLVSLPERAPPALNGLHLRSGRMPRPRSSDEVVVTEAFADAHRLVPGDPLTALMNGRLERLAIVGTALSPEFTYALAPGQLFPDDRRFGVLWMRRSALAPAFDMEGAFNDAALLLEHGASVDAVIERVDRVLEPYGGVGAIARTDQQSAFFVDNEIRQLDTFAWMLPVLFLLVAAFLLNVVVARIVSGQRAEIAALKAFGYRDREVGLHYAQLVGLVTLIGGLLGVALGAWFGAGMVRMYGDYYRFPELPYRLGLGEVLLGLAVALAAAAVGTWGAIRRTVQLPPAEAMRPEAPRTYRRTALERLGLTALVPAWARIVLRELERQPRRALMSVVGIALATGLTIANAFTLDSVNHMLNLQFGIAQREDVQLSLVEPRSLGALSSIERLPGVLHAEPYRTVPVRFRVGARTKNAGITGVPADAALSTLVDERLRTVTVPPSGVLLSRKLADELGLAVGDDVRVEVLEGLRRRVDVRVASIVDTFIGMTAYMDLGALPRLLGETVSMNGARLLVDDARLDELYAEVKRTPVVTGVSTRDSILAKVRELLDENLLVFVTISLAFSLVLAFGVLYNAVRITLAERARDFASLRVLGFERREVAAILFGEIGLLVAIAIPVGLVLGRWMAAMLVRSPGYDTEQFRLPLVVSPATYAMAALCVIVAAALSGWSAWRKLDRIDIVEVLKTRD
jgi:putative ABC transport system permease protein